ncbi:MULTISPECIES: chloride channel protein [Duncaniella]|uniref:CBS domain-containing protein n=5 Tax=Duncaniella muris TaxID=2094150 RepID=A0A2V1ITX4_9BACT|nr:MULTISPECIES: chloride channel protein [Duncaniella]NBH92092.1 chloride channel protein [Muribaculaceae bacterium S4]NBI20493.1 chloride channel protein [Muribaculaceae bacterium Z1]PWB04409.1 CBS domain-containing protein [Duncaniella muris]QCD40090.1 chloride channel protein [Duncaniella sp. C9]QCP71260.1 chloride channel protein [Duncaniella sp. B8]
MKLFFTSIAKSFQDAFMVFLMWRERHIKEKTFVIILALLVGILAGVAALVLKTLIHLISHALTSNINIDEGSLLYLIYPAVGILLTMLFVRYVVRDNISHGVTRVLYAISQNKSRLKRHNMYSSVIASSITIGFGGSVGAEGPIVYTGAAIGSNLGRVFRLSPRILMILVGCGAAAGIAGIFKAPIAGMLFTLEVLMLDLTTVSVMPLLIASITAATVAYVATGYDAEFFFLQSEPFVTGRIPYVILLGLFLGFVSLYFTRSMNMMEGLFRKLGTPWRKMLVGGSVVALLVFLFPPLYGEGYSSIIDLLSGNTESIVNGSIFYKDRGSVWWILGFIAALVLLKSFATSATNGGGGVGGTFAPSLYVGCMAGFFFAYFINTVFGLDLSTKNFALMGMAGVMSGVMHAPLMGIFLTAELTGGYELFLPLLIVSAISYGTIKFFEPYSIYTMRLAHEGKLITHHKDKAVLTLLKIDNVIETDFVAVRPDMNLKEMVNAISRSSRNLFPVIGDDGKLLGVVILDEIRNIMFRPDLYKRMYVNQFMSIPPAKVEVGQSMETVMKTFDATGAWNLPVVEEGRYVGFVSKSKIFNSYRRVLRHYSED